MLPSALVPLVDNKDYVVYILNVQKKLHLSICIYQYLYLHFLKINLISILVSF